PEPAGDGRVDGTDPARADVVERVEVGLDPDREAALDRRRPRLDRDLAAVDREVARLAAGESDLDPEAVEAEDEAALLEPPRVLDEPAHELELARRRRPGWQLVRPARPRLAELHPLPAEARRRQVERPVR